MHSIDSVDVQNKLLSNGYISPRGIAPQLVISPTKEAKVWYAQVVNFAAYTGMHKPDRGCCASGTAEVTYPDIYHDAMWFIG